ncbi:hypothetical protein [Paraburkholderia sp. GAS41]|uniref:hypothetical protein n=1 Tax=Paraburkholderia sp. GAS41 TaxID=3035134 RepID=UPI003D1B18BC
MKTNEQSLRYLVEKWLTPSSRAQLRVIEFSRTRRGRRRYVCVETEDGARSLFFFRHDDGSWYVFPPTSDRTKRDCRLPSSLPEGVAPCRMPSQQHSA